MSLIVLKRDDLTASAKLVYAVMDAGVAKSMRSIATALATSTSTVYKALNDLRAVGLIPGEAHRKPMQAHRKPMRRASESGTVIHNSAVLPSDDPSLNLTDNVLKALDGWMGPGRVPSTWYASIGAWVGEFTEQSVLNGIGVCTNAAVRNLNYLRRVLENGAGEPKRTGRKGISAVLAKADALVGKKRVVAPTPPAKPKAKPALAPGEVKHPRDLTDDEAPF